ncbi:hypothetical protein EVB99_052 [Rhizobium phage RHph_N3_19]|nr:hypothetical protein EVB99_052 [Rhizobium phage RHph_N3_19]
MSEDFYKWTIKMVCLTLITLGVCWCSANQPQRNLIEVKTQEVVK